MTVYVTQENPNFNYMPAEEYGEVVFVTKQDYSLMANSLMNSDLSTDIRRRLTGFDAKKDYIVPSGSPLVMGAVFMVLGRMNRSLRVLKWVSRDNKYVPTTLEI